VNANQIATDRFSNPDSEQRYADSWPDEPQCQQQYYHGQQCGGCSFYAKLNSDYGICCHDASRHFTETVFEHFTCPSYVQEGWGPHSFTRDPTFHCRCEGEPADPGPDGPAP
jgi:hypothetical protein